MTQHRPAAVIVLAAGEGTRMKSATPKVIHPIGGRSLLHHAINAAAGTAPEHLVVVLRHARDQVAEHVAGIAEVIDRTVLVADQDDIPGTGRATECALTQLPDDLTGTVVVTYGDVPLLTAHTLSTLVEHHEEHRGAVTVLSAQVARPRGYGRIVRDAAGDLERIVEEKDADEQQKRITEINSGIYAFDAAVLRESLAQVGTDNAQGEKYLTDVIQIARGSGARVAALTTEDVWQVEGANDRVQLAQLGRELNRRIVEDWMRAGVTVIDPDTTWIDSDVTLASDVTLLPGVQLHGATDIASHAVIGPDTTLTDTEVGAGAQIVRTHGQLAVVGAGATVGPFAYLRPGTLLGAEGKIGTFVETKNARIGTGSKVPHLSYVGDATIGEYSNIGASSVFVNYDGVAKHHTTVGSYVRTGSDTMFVAPVTVGDGAYSGAGTVIRKDVPPGALAMTVAPQRNVENWVVEQRPGTPAAQAAEAAAQAKKESD
ncbi:MULTISPECIES: bifunctional UDP-N-acetylglucosamine diphosphorylase/glucosamine-1-phosphate N-acetyltransferase GlmU [Brevibacterium]|uniref:Bifunctional protein GlmU n=1 Tax=Brevibacterium pityocampae TaxID=506594 RepID=A0ABP8JM85_9MICO|nr:MULTISPECIES: bifunctional UDP-N-acetylglucosamine diphosphorylase/glucosamine-1-phosphate N-acetyltransferase GlmU [unclassified Brevibacterium]MCK1803770.1 bifunctional UDP-N-acetylglucosamine diphosphorylase/glucosamine-1-phosphate N-acetyltransferase GlmU [Brevibacterium sp. R8603A2]QCP05192.1 bifunctional UDP-N-acetylglucosamine diphosphorylase/glucosamine-1-phosphate N-acetyltransferase GlmU [Brevibacterium sp. CS2]